MKTKLSVHLLSSIILATTLTGIPPAYAWKPSTHIFLAEEVLKDALDGNVSLKAWPDTSHELAKALIFNSGGADTNRAQLECNVYTKIFMRQKGEQGGCTGSVPAKKAMTWIINTAVTDTDNGGKTYVQARYDSQTNAYSGDTSVDQALSLLCIRKSQELANNPIPGQTQSVITPGGASKNSWSGGEVFAIPNVVGSSLLSSADADGKCQTAGQNRYGIPDFRMAEFHDGSDPNAGWGFWAQSNDPNLSIPGNRYWVKINDQNANPW